MTPADSILPAAGPDAAIVNAFTIDVEDYFQVSAFDACIERSQWDDMPCRIERNTDLLLGLLDHAGAKATFFTLGWIAQRYPHLIRKIVDQGHEVASHGFSHQRVTDLQPAELRKDLVNARNLLQDVSGQPVIGYRAPSFSIGRTNLWVHDLLAETGHRYSSSIYPIRHDHYGMPEAPRFVHRTPSGLAEIPASSVRIGSLNLPASGGGYFRLLPYLSSRWTLRRINRQDRQPAVFYCHPWEVDPEQPRVAGAPPKAKFRHYLNLSRTATRLARLLDDFRWGRMDTVFAAHIGMAGNYAADTASLGRAHRADQ